MRLMHLSMGGTLAKVFGGVAIITRSLFPQRGSSP